MIMVTTHEAKTKLSALISSVETKHEEVIICRGRKPVARLVPIPAQPDPLEKHPELGPVVILGDITAPLDPEDWPEQCR